MYTIFPDQGGRFQLFSSPSNKISIQMDVPFLVGRVCFLVCNLKLAWSSVLYSSFWCQSLKFRMSHWMHDREQYHFVEPLKFPKKKTAMSFCIKINKISLLLSFVHCVCSLLQQPSWTIQLEYSRFMGISCTLCFQRNCGEQRQSSSAEM